MSESLAVKYRPQTFEETVSQKSIIRILNRQLELDELKNVYLFCGASGCGKTSVARIFARLINKNIGSPIEIDAASNNGVDNVKQIVKSATERSLDSRYKIYIIDEAHMITIQGWNAFLKCIEEPPQYTIFIFCTTDPQKIPSTILNRCMRFNFQRISSENIKNRLLYICEKEGFFNYKETCDYISRISNNQMRDAISYLETCADYNRDLSIENCLNALGNYSYDIMFDLVNNIIDGNIQKSISIINDIYQQGNDLKLFVDKFLDFCLDISKYIIFKNCDITKLPITYQDKINDSINFDNAQQYYQYIVDRLLELKMSIKTDSNFKTTIEVNIIRLCRCQ